MLRKTLYWTWMAFWLGLLAYAALDWNAQRSRPTVDLEEHLQLLYESHQLTSF